MLHLLNKRYRLELFERFKNKFKHNFYLKSPFNQIYLYLPIKYDHIQNIITTKSFYEIKYLEIVKLRYIPKNAVIVDIGSNIGNHLVYFSKTANAKKVYGFEPQKNIFNILSKNLLLNNCGAEIKNIALGDKIQKTQISFFDKSNLGATSLEYNEKGTIQTSTLDEEFKNIQEKINFIKIDVEGFEYFVLRGAKLLMHHKPIIWIEMFNKNFFKVKELLNSFEYEIKDCLGTYNYIYTSKNYWKSIYEKDNNSRTAIQQYYKI